MWLESQKEINHQEDLDVCGRIILKRIFKIRMDAMGWIDLAQDRDQWRALVNTVTNFWVP
jgi:hypothetical protein